MQSVVESTLPPARGSGAEHGPRHFGADDRPAEARKRDGVAPGAAAEIEHARPVREIAVQAGTRSRR